MLFILSDIDECLTEPCQHDGTCTDGINGYTCTCQNGYTGVNCGTGKLWKKGFKVQKGNKIKFKSFLSEKRASLLNAHQNPVKFMKNLFS